MPDFHYTQGDTSPPLVIALRDSRGAAYVPPQGSTATVRAVRQTDGHAVSGSCSISSDQLTWQPSAGDTDEPGIYDVQWKVTLPNGDTIHFPTCAGRNGFVLEVCEAI